MKELIKLLVHSGTLRFGNFTTKSGRESPFFMNFGAINRGADLAKLAGWYADAIMRLHDPLPDVIFGPAYKGIPLAVAVAMELSRKSGAVTGFAFDRKEAKSHGEGGNLIGAPLIGGRRVLVVDDVLTAGTSVGQTLEWMRSFDVKICGVLVGVDRCERASDALGGIGSAASALEKKFNLRVDRLADVHVLIEGVQTDQDLSVKSGMNAEVAKKIQRYFQDFGGGSNQCP